MIHFHKHVSYLNRKIVFILCSIMLTATMHNECIKYKTTTPRPTDRNTSKLVSLQSINNNTNLLVLMWFKTFSSPQDSLSRRAKTVLQQNIKLPGHSAPSSAVTATSSVLTFYSVRTPLRMQLGVKYFEQK